MASSARIDELLKKFDENPRRYFAPLANEYRKAGDVDRAIQLCREHLPQQPGHMSGHIVFGQALFEAGQLEESRRVFEAALTLDPENLIALRHLGDIARNDGDVASAREWYQRVLDADPRNEEIASQIAALDSMDGAAPSDAAAAEHASFPAGDLGTLALLDPMASADGAEAAATLLDLEPTSHGAASPTPSPELTFLELGGAPVDTRADTPPHAAPSVRAPADAAPSDEAPLDLDLAGLDVGLDAPAAPEPASLELREAIVTEDAFLLDIPADAGDAGRASSDLGLDDPFASATMELDAGTPEPRMDEDEPRAGSGIGGDDALSVERASESAWTPEPARAPEPAGGSVLGLETMEFVPPSPRGAESLGDPFQGHVVRDGEPAPATPSAFVTETMAELYLQQGFRDEALSVYKQLVAQHPEDENLRERVAQLESGSRSSVSVADLPDEVIEAARQRHESREAAPPSARAFFGALAARRPGRPAAEGDAPLPFLDPSATVSDEPFAGGYDEFGFPTASAAPRAATPTGRTPASPQGALPSFDVVEDEAPAADALLAGEPAIEPATLDYLAHAEPAAAPSASYDESARFGGGELGPVEELPEESAPPWEAAPAAPAAEAGTMDGLFQGTAVETEDDQAATALADAFRALPDEAGGAPATGASGEQPAAVQGNAARPGRGELSLDQVFRDTPRRSASQRRSTPGFSFDQFFSDATPSATPVTRGPGEDATGARPTPGAGGRSTDESAADIEQFNTWLEGLKKK